MNKYNVDVENELDLKILLSNGFTLFANNNADKNQGSMLTCMEKYFLFRIKHVFGFDNFVCEPMDILVPVLGVSYKNIVHAQTSLESKGIISLEKVKGERGRPKIGFTIHSDVLHEGLRCGHGDSPYQVKHKTMITTLLFWGDQADEVNLEIELGNVVRSQRSYLKDKLHKLDGKERITMSVLFALADSFGCVEDMGQSALSNIAGLSKSQFIDHVDKLKDKKYIRSVIAGFTDSNIFGQVNSVYCLNIGKTKIRGQHPLEAIIFNEVVNEFAPIFNEASQLISTASWSNDHSSCQIWVKSLINNHEKAIAVDHKHLSLLKGPHNNTFCDYLQSRLEKYACSFLSLNLIEVIELEVADMRYQSIINKIFDDLWIGSNEKERLKEVKKLADILGEVSFAMSKSFYQLLKRETPRTLSSGREFGMLARLSKNTRVLANTVV